MSYVLGSGHFPHFLWWDETETEMRQHFPSAKGFRSQSRLLLHCDVQGPHMLALFGSPRGGGALQQSPTLQSLSVEHLGGPLQGPHHDIMMSPSQMPLLLQHSPHFWQSLSLPQRLFIWHGRKGHGAHLPVLPRGTQEGNFFSWIQHLPSPHSPSSAHPPEVHGSHFCRVQQYPGLQSSFRKQPWLKHVPSWQSSPGLLQHFSPGSHSQSSKHPPELPGTHFPILQTSFLPQSLSCMHSGLGLTHIPPLQICPSKHS